MGLCLLASRGLSRQPLVGPLFSTFPRLSPWIESSLGPIMNIVCLKFKVCAREMRFIKPKEREDTRHENKES